MQVKKLKILRFRGIAELDWLPGKRVVCLVGRNDTTKTTILDSIEYTLAPRWYVPFADTDFFGCDHSKGFDIEVTIGDLPTEFLSDDRFGLDLRGWHAEEGLKDEPDDDCEKVLTVRLRVDSSLEPQWTVVNDRNPDGRPIRWQERARLGVARLGAETDRHLAWGRGSALARLTENKEDTGAAVAEAQRLARQAVAEAPMRGLQEVAERAQEEAKKFGVPAEQYRAMLDTKAIAVGLGAVSLHDGEIPVASAGLGTRRLVSLALQRAQVTDGAIVLIDEIEHGLEPHRLRGLIRQLDVKDGQIIMTSHSPVAVHELRAEKLGVVRCDSGHTTVHSLDSSADKTITEAPEAVLSRKIIVCEGKTEQGLCKAMDCHWSTEHGADSFAYAGVAVVYGEGSNAVDKAKKWAKAGYEVALLGDSDKDTSAKDAQASEGGVEVIRWGGMLAIEKRICQDLPDSALDEIVKLAVFLHGEDRVWHNLKGRNLERVPLTGSCIESWVRQDRTLDDIRNALGGVAGAHKWFKTIEGGEQLGNIVARHLTSIPKADLTLKLKKLRAWVHG